MALGVSHANASHGLRRNSRLAISKTEVRGFLEILL